MKKVRQIEEVTCDLCGSECDEFAEVSYPVVFDTDQTEGRGCKPYISQKKIDVCPSCAKKVLMVRASGAMGFNKYRVVER